MQTKDLGATLLLIDFSKAFGSIYRGKMEQIQFANGLPKETISNIMMLNKNTKPMVCSPDGDIDFFNIVIGVLRGDTLGPYLFILCLDYILWTSIDLIKENDYIKKKQEPDDIW